MHPIKSQTAMATATPKSQPHSLTHSLNVVRGGPRETRKTNCALISWSRRPTDRRTNGRSNGKSSGIRGDKGLRDGRDGVGAIDRAVRGRAGLATTAEGGVANGSLIKTPSSLRKGFGRRGGRSVVVIIVRVRMRSRPKGEEHCAAEKGFIFFLI